MDPFWDRFVYRVSLGLGEGCFRPGFPIAAEVLRTAFESRMELIPQLNDLSRLLILLTCPSDYAAHEAADQAYRGAGREWWRDGLALRDVLPPRLAELYLVNCLGEPRQSSLARGALRALLQPALNQFV